MAHHLVLFLGTGALLPPDGAGGAVADAREGAYRPTPYAFDDGEGRFTSAVVKTPFVGEAILRLAPDRFSHVHVFGTAQSMWDALAESLGEGHVGLALDLIEAKQDGSLRDGDARLGALAEAVGAAHGVATSCAVLPLPDTEAHTWSMLGRLADLPGLGDGDTLSIDVTHGLRVQPLFMVLAARYLQALRSRVTLGHVFYGAYDFRRPHGSGPPVSPVLDLRAHVALLDWIDAARAFDRSADAAPLATLLNDSGPEAVLADKATDLTRTLQANALALLRGGGGAFLSALRAVPAGRPPLDLVRPALEHLPRRLNAGAAWEALLFVAEHHAEHGRLGLALLSAWEAARARVADAYGMGSRPLGREENEHVKALLLKVSALDRLRRDRNAVAHATLYASRDDNERLKDLRGRVGEVLAETRAYLEGPEIATRAGLHPWTSPAP